jgi:hypothetical protein
MEWTGWQFNDLAPWSRSIHTAPQLEHCKNLVDDRSMHVGGKQRIKTIAGCIIPINIVNGLPYLPMQPPTDEEVENLPSIIMTSGDDWDQTVLDNKITDVKEWYNSVKEESNRFDDHTLQLSGQA